MGSREEILSRIAKVKPEGNELPEDLSFIPGTGNLLESFVQTARNNGSQVTFVENTDGVLAYLRENIASDKRIISNITTLNNELKNNEEEINDPHELENVEVAIVEGSLGVAENAAIWITEKQMKYRALPFITQHLFVILAADKIVALMHDAYKIIEIEGGFSSFISGPSKTADIEQSLVIGAHGARSHHIFIINNQ
ncbi:lactate utilization protein B/C [Elizabethkingia anophelis]|uniref:LutC/YkgG family protein n=1 Tax=Elizabethkingia anophelis TaxID=1117645 RepID=UPI0004E3F16D|nr:LUD domain-containing protein [Elizabethkingia anophelis]KFC36119.1 lactate utilization protein B/C [Elizabethkingia anophelis]MCT3699684.1 LUD domain-containing protein [Elizabethkingia anophelis]MCT3787265.1 LUD domain-containing protein [Elizabethkingia anophelis]MDV3501683.1 lactate utilization protein B/C [Elizabethkingia anophelis]MDV3547124.1 lactate utilization protein B/C [Elizabethkingia anophelis]